MKNKTFYAFIFLAGSILSPQNAGPIFLNSILRKENTLLVCENNNKIYQIDKNFKKIESIPMPYSNLNLFSINMFILDKKIGISLSDWENDEHGEYAINRYFEFKDDKWHSAFESRLKEDDGGYKFVFPLKNGDFFAVNRHPFKINRKYDSIFYILRKNAKGEWVRHRTVDSDVPPRAFRFKGLPRQFQVAQVGDYLAVADPHPGYIWLFHQEDGRLKRLVKLYDDLDLKRLEKNDFSSAMLGIHPTEDGLFMIAARPESTVLNDDFAQRARSGLQALQAYQEIRVDEGTPPLLVDYAWKHHPEVVWMTLDPETGSLKTLDPPPKGAKTEIHSWFEAQSFHWIPTWDGEVVFGGLERAIEEARQREAKAEAERKAQAEAERRAQTEPTPEKARAKP